MDISERSLLPLGKVCAVITKQYLSVLGSKLNHLQINRYYYAFWVIAKNDGQITQKDLSTVLNADKVIIVRIVDYLSEKQFIQRKENPEDRRSHLLAITKTGEQYVKDVEKALEQTDNELLHALPDDRKSDFISDLITVANEAAEIQGERVALDYSLINKDG
tara:strand:+ start:7962 stop:8447 length:486 start_codon:yes stop_codon:yes gene_type:complete